MSGRARQQSSSISSTAAAVTTCTHLAAPLCVKYLFLLCTISISSYRVHTPWRHHCFCSAVNSCCRSYVLIFGLSYCYYFRQWLHYTLYKVVYISKNYLRTTRSSGGHQPTASTPRCIYDSYYIIILVYMYCSCRIISYSYICTAVILRMYLQQCKETALRTQHPPQKQQQCMSSSHSIDIYEWS